TEEENYDEYEEYSEYMDGTYVGSGYGYHGGLTTVAVTIENGQIVDIETIEENDQPHHGQDYYSSAFNLIYPDILYYQSADVDAVSGATYSSRGIIDAVSDALSQARR
ncbi:MAG: FMN-binding protein, partial [Parasporobacterium sp.]|nr:FMN-binding protein [Parasporobacterium sp.]